MRACCSIPTSLIFFLSALAAFSQPATNAALTLAPPYGELPPTFGQQYGAWIVTGVLVLLALAAVSVWKIFTPKPAPVVPPEVQARRALEKLASLPEDGKTLSEISQVLRRYLVAALALPPGERTTGEFCAALVQSDKIPPALAQAIAGFLREGDERKFAPVAPSASQHQPAAEQALKFVEQVARESVGTSKEKTA